MAIQDKKQKKCQNGDRLNKQKKFYSWSGDKEDRRWQITILDDILSIISDLLPLSDFISFRGVCCNWRRVPSYRSNIAELSKKDPWCILYDFDARDKDMCLFYQCNSRRSCGVKLPGLRGAKCFASKHGWLFIRRNNDYLLFNPLTLEEIFLPKYPSKSVESSVCQVGTFSASPSSSQHCVVVLLSSRDFSTVRLASCHLKASEWMVNILKVDTRDVSYDFVLLPNPRQVFFRTVDDAAASRGSNRIMCIYVVYENHILALDLMKRRHEFVNFDILKEGAKRDYDEQHNEIFNWISMLKEVHSDDLIRRFGKEFTFSFCLFDDCERVDGHNVLNSHTCTVPNGPVIKAALLYKE